MSRSQVHRKVKQLTGSSTSIHVRNIKLERAKAYLLETDMTIAEITYACGIQSPQNMSKYFLLSHGVTPSQYRNQYKQPERQRHGDQHKSSVASDAIDTRKAIAVFAFENISQDPDQSFWGVGIADEIMSGLMRLNDVRALGSTSSLYFKKKDFNLQSVRADLDADYCLLGSIQVNGQNIRLMVQLLDTNDGILEWTERYEGPIESIFQIQNEVASQVVAKLKVTISSEENSTNIVEQKTSDVQAYQLYLKGRHEFELRNDLGLCISYFQKAIEIDACLLYTSPSPRDRQKARMPSSA